MANINSSTLPLSYNVNRSDLHNSEHLQLVERLTTHITLIVTVIGLIGNACTIIVLNRQSMRKWRSSMLLTALAAVDFLYLLIIFLSILDSLTNQRIGLHRSLMFCQVTVYITHVCSFLSATFTLAFTLQRFVAVIFPLHANTIISNRSSIINILILVFFGCGFYSFSFFLTNLINGQCREDENYPALFPLLVVDTCLTFVLPFICIFVFNCAIVYKLQNRKRFGSIFESSMTLANNPRNRHRLKGKNICDHERQQLCQSNINNNHIPTNTTTTNELTPVSPTISNPSRQGISQRTTKMLVICSTTFLLFNSPYCAVLLYCIISDVVLDRTLSILRHFYFMSFCLNFFLYSLCGNRFRHELVTLFKALCRKCCSQKIRSHWLRIEKIPQQTSLTRINQRADV